MFVSVTFFKFFVHCIGCGNFIEESGELKVSRIWAKYVYAVA